jgi:hypothetical protein
LRLLLKAEGFAVSVALCWRLRFAALDAGRLTWSWPT